MFDNAILTRLLREQALRAPSTPSREPESACQALRRQSEDHRQMEARTSVSDLPTGPKEPRSTVLTVEEEAVVVAFRRHTLLPLDDCLYALSTGNPASDALVAASMP
jgi:hypothetical protein